MTTLTDILVATDFSEPSAAALRYGCALARHFKSTLHVVHAVALAPNVLTGTGTYLVAVPDLQRDIEEAARKELDELPIECGDAVAVQRVVITSNVAAAANRLREAKTHWSHRHRHARARRSGARADRQRRRARRSHRALSGADRPMSGTGIHFRREHMMLIWFAIPLVVGVAAVLVTAIRRRRTSSETPLHLHR
jgi:nucleotide-binding universal stress UspA family protein